MAEGDTPKRAAARKTTKPRQSRAPNVLVTPDEAGRAAEELIAKADENRAGALGTLELVRKARVSALGRELERLQAEDDPRAQAVERALEATHTVVRRLAVETRRAAIAPPKPAKDVSKVHGHVLNHRLQPVRSANVHVVDREGKRVRGASASTDAEGYFELEWTPREPEEVVLRVTAGRSRVLYEEAHPRPRGAGSAEYAELLVEEERS
jgi:hypothetical protein